MRAETGDRKEGVHTKAQRRKGFTRSLRRCGEKSEIAKKGTGELGLLGTRERFAGFLFTVQELR
jgi:hypothetical protein